VSSAKDMEDGIAFIEDEPIIDLEVAAPAGRPCFQCGAPLEDGDHFCVACGARSEQDEAGDAVVLESIHLQCESCGSQIEIEPGHRSYVCPFCESTYVVEVDAQANRQRPEFVIGFTLTPEQAHERFRAWIGSNGLFHPADLKNVQLGKKLRGIYLPFWSFSMLARSRWKANIGEYWWRTETYTTMENGKLVTKTRRVQETEWWSLQGNHHHYYSGYLVSASRGLSQAEAEQIKPFNLPALKRYQPYFLAGWQAEDYTVDRQEALQACQEEFRRREYQNISGFMPGDTYGGLGAETEFDSINSDLCLLPVYMMNYQYHGQAYRFLINGQTGKIVGQKPYSRVRVGVAVAIGVVVAVTLAGLVALVAGGLN
jgi:predicted RNA-binding Zn-ribbon protein involved in translation (DUF1610 family)